MKDTADNTNIADNNKQDRLRDKLQMINMLVLALAPLSEINSKQFSAASKKAIVEDCLF